MLLNASSGTKPIILNAGHVYITLQKINEEVPFSMAIGNEELMQ